MYVLIAALLLLIGIFVYKESSGYNIVEYSLATDKKMDRFVRFVMISDLHDTDVTHDGNTRLFESIDSLSPDFIILCGDMINSYLRRDFDNDVTFSLLGRLSQKYRVYYGLGNHEQRYREEPQKFTGMYEKLTGSITRLGIELLSDSYSDIGNIRIYGFDIPMEQYKRFGAKNLSDEKLTETFGSIDESRYNILIAHNPVYFDAYTAFAPDLVLAGHLHGGVVALPGIGGVISPQLKLFPRYDYGKYESGHTTMIVSRGIGWHTIPIRIFNKAEIVSVTIRSQDQGEENGN